MNIERRGSNPNRPNPGGLGGKVAIDPPYDRLFLPVEIIVQWVVRLRVRYQMLIHSIKS